LSDARQLAQQEEARRNAIAAAQSLERRGMIDAAMQAFAAADAPDEVARLLVSQRRFGDAGQYLMNVLAVPPEKVSALDAPKKKLAMQAAICFGRAGDATTSAMLFVALGEKERAVDVLKRAGDHAAAARVLGGGAVRASGASPMPTGTQASMSTTVAQNLEAANKFDLALDAYIQLRQPHNAARMAVKLGKFGQAGELYTQAGMQYEAAECFSQAGDARRSLDALLRVPRDDQRYQQAALMAIRLASDLNNLDFQLDHFLTKFLSSVPQNERDAEGLYLAAKLYQRNDHLESAKDAYRKIIAVAPNYRDARAQLAAIEAETRGSAMVFEQILKEEQAFRGGPRERVAPNSATLAVAALPELPDLPELPSWPVAPTPVVHTDAMTVASVPPGMRAGGMTPPPHAPRPPVAARPPQVVTVPPARPVSRPPDATAPGIPVKSTIDNLLVPGGVVAERYRIEAKIGQGGMAAVYRAFDLELSERIALKVFTTQNEDEQLVARFKQELSLSRQLHHPNIIRLYDIGIVQGFRYLTMELLSGGDLKSKLGRPLDVQTGVNYLLQCCAALQHVHDRGVVHRDIKPANLFVTNENVIKLMDFGIAKRQATPGLTVAGMIAGTPEYMSPEQISGFEKVTASTDIYALGIMAYEMFTGAVPFRHPELMPLLMMQLNEIPPSPRTKNPALPPAIETIVMKLLAKDASQRFLSCNELAAALQSVVRRTA
jgi:serine/threonine-protein kinase